MKILKFLLTLLSIPGFIIGFCVSFFIQSYCDGIKLEKHLRINKLKVKDEIN